MRLKFKNRRLYILILLIFCVSVFLGFVFRRMENPFSDAFSSYASKAVNTAVNKAIYDCISDDSISYNDLITLNQNSDGAVVSLTTNTFKVNNLKAKITECVDNNIRNLDREKLHIKLGTSQNNIMLSAFGPTLKVKIKPYSSTITKFRDEFTDAGMNQVRHSIYLDIVSNITISGFSVRKTEIIENTILIADTIIVGNVPQLHSGCFSDFNKLKG